MQWTAFAFFNFRDFSSKWTMMHCHLINSWIETDLFIFLTRNYSRWVPIVFYFFNLCLIERVLVSSNFDVRNFFFLCGLMTWMNRNTRFYLWTYIVKRLVFGIRSAVHYFWKPSSDEWILFITSVSICLFVPPYPVRARVFVYFIMKGFYPVLLFWNSLDNDGPKILVSQNWFWILSNVGFSAKK